MSTTLQTRVADAALEAAIQAEPRSATRDAAILVRVTLHTTSSIGQARKVLHELDQDAALALLDELTAACTATLTETAS